MLTNFVNVFPKKANPFMQRIRHFFKGENNSICFRCPFR